MPTNKTPVIEHLFNDHLAGKFPNGIVSQSDVVAAIRATSADLSTSNPANFLKDIIRKDTANTHWPASLVSSGMGARQRYGNKRVFQFVPFAPGQTQPFPDRFLPNASTPVHQLQSATVPFAARQLGRKEESWLMQVVVELRVIETQLSVFSPLKKRLRDVTHLQMSMKTQPEIDAVFLVSHGASHDILKGSDLFSVITCEAKQLGERILEDQIREQVAKAFKETKKIARPTIGTIKPMAVQMREVQLPSGPERRIYVVEFQRISRKTFETYYANTKTQPERLYDMPLRAVSTAFHIPTPSVRGINL